MEPMRRVGVGVDVWGLLRGVDTLNPKLQLVVTGTKGQDECFWKMVKKSEDGGHKAAQ